MVHRCRATVLSAARCRRGGRRLGRRGDAARRVARAPRQRARRGAGPVRRARARRAVAAPDWAVDLEAHVALRGRLLLVPHVAARRAHGGGARTARRGRAEVAVGLGPGGREEQQQEEGSR